jgi:hypothetical protein
VLPIAAIDFDDAAAHYRNAKEFSVARTGRKHDGGAGTVGNPANIG